MKNILVCVDFDEKAYQLIDKAIEIAKKFNSKVWIVHIAAPDPDFVGYSVGPQYIRDFRAEELRKEHSLIQKYAQVLEDMKIDAEGLLIQGATGEMILAEIVKLDIDLVILGHHKHSLIHHFFVGDTGSEIINKSNIPVLSVPLN